MENFIFFLIPIIAPIVAHSIVTQVPRLSSQYNGYMVLMVTFVSIGFGIMGDVKAVDAKQMGFDEFYSRLLAYTVSLITWGFIYRNTVLASFKKTYYSMMAVYTYVIFVTGVLMHLVSPIIHIA